MNKTGIEWADFTWNPLVGCKHGCNYCYARRLNTRFQMIPEWDNPIFFPDRLQDRIPKLPRNRNRIAEAISPDKPVIFVGSMCDLFGKWVADEIIRSIITYTRNHDAIFMFLTKNPLRYFWFTFPQNCILGTTIESSSKLDRANRAYFLRSYGTQNKLFASIEPILSPFPSNAFKWFDFIIIGADSTPGARVPNPEWITSINHELIYYKDSVIKITGSLL